MYKERQFPNLVESSISNSGPHLFKEKPNSGRKKERIRKKKKNRKQKEKRKKEEISNE